MPLADLPVQRSTANGAVLTFVPSIAGGHAIKNRANNVCLLVSTKASATIVTIRSVIPSRPGDATYPANTVADRTFSIAGDKDAIIGPFPNAFNNSDGSFEASYSVLTNVDVAAVEIPLI